MDKYLVAITKDEEKIRILTCKKEEIQSCNQERNYKATQYERKETKLSSEIGKHKKIKYYLENKKSCLKEFYRKAILFGLKWGGAFLGVILLISLFSAEFMSLSILQLLASFTSIGGVLGFVEFRHVSREYRSLTKDYNGNVEIDLANLYKDLENLQNARSKNKEAIDANHALLLEVDDTIKRINEEISLYRSSRNQLIEKLIRNMDSYIKDFEPREIDIHKVAEKKIQ